MSWKLRSGQTCVSIADFSLRRRKSGSFWSRMKRKNSSSPKTPLPSKSTHPANAQLNAGGKKKQEPKGMSLANEMEISWNIRYAADSTKNAARVFLPFMGIPSWIYMDNMYISISIYLSVRAISSKHVGTYYHFAKELIQQELMKNMYVHAANP